MKYRKFGRTNLMVSEISIGTWAFGGPTLLGNVPIGWGDVDDKMSIKTLETCIDNGINLVDTADNYGMGHSEEIVEKTVKNYRDKVYIVSKTVSQKTDLLCQELMTDKKTDSLTPGARLKISNCFRMI